MEKQEDKNLTNDFVFEKTDLIFKLRNNIEECMKEQGLTIKDLSEKADIPFESLKGVLYNKKRTDCNLSTVVKIALATGMSLDKLVGAGTIDPITEESLDICQKLPEHSLYLIRYFIRHQNKLYEKHEKGKKIISVFKPQCVRGNLLTTNVVEPLSVDHLPDNVKSAIYLGIRIPCEHYMPYYAPNDTILVAADRKGMSGERCVITLQDKILLVTKQSYIKNGKKEWKYVALMNDTIEIPETEIDDKVGYIVGFLNPDGNWGSR